MERLQDLTGLHSAPSGQARPGPWGPHSPSLGHADRTLTPGRISLPASHRASLPLAPEEPLAFCPLPDACLAPARMRSKCPS